MPWPQDWSNAKALWAKAKPMNCDEMMLEQVERSTAASPGSTYWVYRNGVKALPWFASVRVKLNDPAFSRWFLRFSPAVRANHSAAHVPVCDPNYQPPTGKSSMTARRQRADELADIAAVRTLS